MSVTGWSIASLQVSLILGHRVLVRRDLLVVEIDKVGRDHLEEVCVLSALLWSVGPVVSPHWNM